MKPIRRFFRPGNREVAWQDAVQGFLHRLRRVKPIPPREVEAGYLPQGMHAAVSAPCQRNPYWYTSQAGQRLFKLSLYRPAAFLSLRLGADKVRAVVLYCQFKVHG